MNPFGDIKFHPGDKCVVYNGITHKWEKAIVDTVYTWAPPNAERSIGYRVELKNKRRKNKLHYEGWPEYIFVGPEEIREK